MIKVIIKLIVCKRKIIQKLQKIYKKTEKNNS